MLRPRLVYLSASFYPYDDDALCNLAVSVELIHLASLIHDDVIDHSSQRRGRESLNARWGEKISVLAGDYLFASAFYLIGQLGYAEIMKQISSTIKVMCGGEIRQLNQAFSLQLSQDEYFDKSFAKTACLFACACKVGALASEMPEKESRSLEQFGLCLGYAYQILDDVLDFVADSKELGKPVGADLLEGNFTLPVLLALEDADHGPRMRNLLSKGRPGARDLTRILRVLKDSNSLENSVRWSGAFLQQGLEFLSYLPDQPARHELKNLAIFLMDGYYKTLNPPVQDLEA